MKAIEIIEANDNNLFKSLSSIDNSSESSNSFEPSNDPVKLCSKCLQDSKLVPLFTVCQCENRYFHDKCLIEKIQETNMTKCQKCKQNFRMEDINLKKYTERKGKIKCFRCIKFLFKVFLGLLAIFIFIFVCAESSLGIFFLIEHKRSFNMTIVNTISVDLWPPSGGTLLFGTIIFLIIAFLSVFIKLYRYHCNINNNNNNKRKNQNQNIGNKNYNKTYNGDMDIPMTQLHNYEEQQQQYNNNNKTIDKDATEELVELETLNTQDIDPDIISFTKQSFNPRDEKK